MHENSTFRKKAEAFFAGQGFYIVLILCIAVIGASAWIIFRNTSAPDGDLSVSDTAGAEDALAQPPADVQIPSVPVVLGHEEAVTPVLREAKPVLIDKSLAAQLSSEVSVDPAVTAPVEKWQRLGTLTMRAGDGVIAELPLVAPEAVARLTWWDVFRRLLRGVCMG